MFAQDDNQSAHKTLNLSIILISKHQWKANNANSLSKLKVLEYSADDEFIYTSWTSYSTIRFEKGERFFYESVLHGSVN